MAPHSSLTRGRHIGSRWGDTIPVPDGLDSDFDHGAFDPKTRRGSLHIGVDRIEVIDHDQNCHVATLQGVPEAAGVVAHDAHILITNRGLAGLAFRAHTSAAGPEGAPPPAAPAPDQYCASIGSATLVVEA